MIQTYNAKIQGISFMTIAWEQTLNPVILEYWGIQIRYNGLLYAIIVFLIYQLLSYDVIVNKIKMSRDQVTNLIFLTIIGGVIGGRIVYILLHFNYYFGITSNWPDIFALWQGGLSIFGGLTGGALSFWMICKFYGLKVWVLADFISPLLFLGQGIGRLGNYFNGDDYGVPTGSSWGVIFRYGPAAIEFPEIPLHPVMLYEAFLTLLCFVLLYLIRNKGFRPGLITALYVILYSIIRFWLCFYWAEEVEFFEYNATIFITIPIIIIALGLIYTNKLYEQPGKKKVREYVTDRTWKL